MGAWGQFDPPAVLGLMNWLPGQGNCCFGVWFDSICCDLWSVKLFYKNQYTVIFCNVDPIFFKIIYKFSLNIFLKNRQRSILAHFGLFYQEFSTK